MPFDDSESKNNKQERKENNSEDERGRSGKKKKNDTKKKKKKNNTEKKKKKNNTKKKKKKKKKKNNTKKKKKKKNQKEQQKKTDIKDEEKKTTTEEGDPAEGELIRQVTKAPRTNCKSAYIGCGKVTTEKVRVDGLADMTFKVVTLSEGCCTLFKVLPNNPVMSKADIQTMHDQEFDQGQSWYGSEKLAEKAVEEAAGGTVELGMYTFRITRDVRLLEASDPETLRSMASLSEAVEDPDSAAAMRDMASSDDMGDKRVMAARSMCSPVFKPLKIDGYIMNPDRVMLCNKSSNAVELSGISV
jgi:hypothetical protein